MTDASGEAGGGSPPPPTADETPSAGAPQQPNNNPGSASGPGGRHGRQNNRRRHNNRRHQQQQPRAPKFEGRCDDLKGYIYDCNDSKQADAYAKTTKEVAEYVGRTFKYGNDVRLAIETMTVPTIPQPPDPAQNATRTEERLWEKRVDEVVKRETHLEENLKTLYSLVWGQCTEAMRAKVRALPQFGTMSATANSIELLECIKSQAFSYQSQKYKPQSLHEAKRRLYTLQQDKHRMASKTHTTRLRSICATASEPL